MTRSTKLRTYKNLWIPLLITFLFVWNGLARGASLELPNQDRAEVVATRGKDSLIEKIEMGPAATEKWRQIQALIAKPEQLRSFSALIALFDLNTKKPSDQLDSSPDGGKYRVDAEDSKSSIIRTFDYWVRCDDARNFGCDGVLKMYFFIENICISNMEVRRLYGEPNRIGVASHGAVPKEVADNPVGFGFGYTELRYAPVPNSRRKFSVAFSFAPSGCAKMIQFTYPLDSK